MNNIISQIGNTPLIYLREVSELTSCNIYGKAEFLNPGLSVKDRAALSMIENAEKRGELKKGGTIVEGTAGNTGIGIALVANAKGYNVKIIIPETQSQEKFDTLLALGVDLIKVPAVPFSNPENYQHVARRIAEEEIKTNPNGAIFADQWNNLDNMLAHYNTTGPEILEQTNNEIDGFICAVGTGGTLSGVSKYLREKKPQIKIGLADPKGAAMYNYFAKNKVEASEGNSISEGIGLGRVTPIIEEIEKIDFCYSIEDNEALPYVYNLVKNEGIILGGSSAINIAGAINLAKELGKGSTVVTILCDHGSRYQSKLYNKDFLKKKNIPIPLWLEG
jgi:cysteine synthase A